MTMFQWPLSSWSAWNTLKVQLRALQQDIWNPSSGHMTNCYTYQRPNSSKFASRDLIHNIQNFSHKDVFTRETLHEKWKCILAEISSEGWMGSRLPRGTSLLQPSGMKPGTEFRITAATPFPNLKWASGSTCVSSTSMWWARLADPSLCPPRGSAGARGPWKGCKDSAHRCPLVTARKDTQPQLRAAGKERGKRVREEELKTPGEVWMGNPFGLLGWGQRCEERKYCWSRLVCLLLTLIQLIPLKNIPGGVLA